MLKKIDKITVLYIVIILSRQKLVTIWMKNNHQNPGSFFVTLKMFHYIIINCYFVVLFLYTRSAALGRSEESLQAAIAAAAVASTPSSVSSPSFSMGWPPYIWPASIADLSVLSKLKYTCT